jgi:hypothetical protein
MKGKILIINRTKGNNKKKKEYYHCIEIFNYLEKKKQLLGKIFLNDNIMKGGYFVL